MIYYLNSYTNIGHCTEREVSVAANSKIEYILKTISENFEVINISSAASTGGYKNRKKVKEGNITYYYLPSLSIRFKMYKTVFKAYCFIFLVSHLKKNDIVIVYHSLFWVRLMPLLKKFKRFVFLLELNDFYQYHFSGDFALYIEKIQKEYFSLPDKFILANPDMLPQLGYSREYIVNYGAYKVNPVKKKQEGKIKVIYSGVAEKLRGAAFLAVKCARYLPDNYELHLACYGTDGNLCELESEAEEENRFINRKVVYFHGTLNEHALDELMSHCDIALSCHGYKPGEEYKAMYSFPSKIPLNMGAGLYVVSPKLKTFQNTPFDDAMVYFDEFEPESIAKAIMKAGELVRKSGQKDRPREIVSDLDRQFREDMKKLLNGRKI